METTTGKSRRTLFHDPVKLRQSLLSRHPLCTSTQPYQGEKPTVYLGTAYRSVSEAKWGMQFHLTGVENDYEVVKTYRPNGIGYKPDFYLRSVDALVEVADFRSRFAQEKIDGCKEAATRLQMPVFLVKGFPWFSNPDPMREITMVFMPGGLDLTDPEVAAAWPQVNQFLDLFKDNEVRATLRHVMNTTFENLDPATGEPRLPQLLRFRNERDAVARSIGGLGEEALRLFALLESGYPERRYPEIAKDLNCSPIDAAVACRQLAEAKMLKQAPAYEKEWLALDIDQITSDYLDQDLLW